MCIQVENHDCLIHKNQAIIKIQSLWRGHRVRRNFLARDLFLLAKRFLNGNVNMASLPKAPAGVTPVYLHPTSPIVFKALGVERSKRRFSTMCAARDLCVQKGYSRLLIPKARPYGEYNIEDKLLVYDVRQRDQVALYEENQSSFTQAVREFTGFLCQSVFPDILTETHPYRDEAGIPIGRCDNLPLLLEGNQGLIALIDLGGVSIRKEQLLPEQAFECARTSLYIFPHHFDDIFETVKSFCPEISEKHSLLIQIGAQARTQYQNIFKSHFQFVQQKIGSLCFVPSKDLIQNTSCSEDTLQQVLKIIALPIKHKLAELTTRQETLTTQVCARFVTIPFNDLAAVFPSDSSASSTKKIILAVLDALMGHEICYANLYRNRSQELLIRIHF